MLSSTVSAACCPSCRVWIEAGSWKLKVKEMKFKRNEYIIVEGDEGSSFYLIVEGTAIATKNFGGPEP